MLAVADRGDAPAGRHAGIGQVDPDRVVVAHPALGGVERRPRGRLLAARLGAELAGRDLGRPLQVARDDRRDAFLELRLSAHRLPVRDLGLGLDPLPLLAAKRLRGGLLGLLRRVLLGVEPRPPLRVRATEHAELVLVELGGVIHQLEKRHVVAHHDERAPPSADHVGQARPRIAVEVVRRLVEQDDRGVAKADAGDSGQHRLAA